MNEICNEHLIDVRDMPARARHPAIFGTWGGLNNGESIVLVNDHDPLPLFYQFSCEHAGVFRWEYLEQGPAVWRVRISRGDFPDPGFTPRPHTTSPRVTTAPITLAEPLVLDTRPIFGRGETPCGAIDEAIESLIPGQALVLLVPFEPAPLYQKLRVQGFSHAAARQEDGTWRIEFRK